MQMIVILDGQTYLGEVTHPTEKEAEDGIAQFYSQVNEFDCMKLGLIDGDTLILGKESFKRAVFIFRK